MMNILFHHFTERRRVSDGDLNSRPRISDSEIFRNSPTNSLYGKINLLTLYDFYDTQWNLLRAGNTRGAHVRIIPYYRPRGTIEWWKRPRFSRRTYLSSLGRVTVKPPVDSSTLLRIVLFRRTPFCVWKRWNILPLLFPTRISRGDVYLAPFRFISPTSHLILRSFVHLPPPSDKFARISIRRNVYCAIISPRSSSRASFSMKLSFPLSPR